MQHATSRGTDVGAISESIDRDGFAVVPSAFSADEMRSLGQALVDVVGPSSVRRKGTVYGIRNLFDVCPEVARLATAPPIRRVIEPILGPDCFAVRATFFDKAPGANWSLAWHQDSVIAVQEKLHAPGFVAWSPKAGVWQVQPPADVLSGMLAVRVHLDDSENDNGPLRVIPSSHKHGWLDEESKPSEIDEWKRRVPETVLTVGAGGLILMRPLLLHASAAATQPRHRRVVHIEFANQPLPGCLRWRWTIRA